MNSKAIGKRIREARERAGMTQEELACQLGISDKHVSVIERGIKSPKLETFINIANVLNVPSDTLLQDVVNNSSDHIESEVSFIIRYMPESDKVRILNAIRAFAKS